MVTTLKISLLLLWCEFDLGSYETFCLRMETYFIIKNDILSYDEWFVMSPLSYHIHTQKNWHALNKISNQWIRLNSIFKFKCHFRIRGKSTYIIYDNSNEIGNLIGIQPHRGRPINLHSTEGAKWKKNHSNWRNLPIFSLLSNPFISHNLIVNEVHSTNK